MPIRPGAEVLAHVTSKWKSELPLVAQEEAVVTRYFEQGADVDQFGNQLVIRKIGAIPGTTLGASTDPSALTPTNNTEVTATASPTFAYGYVEIGISALTRTMAGNGFEANRDKYLNAYRRQIALGVAATRDTTGSAMVASLSNTRGSSGDNFNKSLLLDGYTLLMSASKNHVTINRETGEAQRQMKYLCYHTNQLKHLLNILEFNAAYYRGDAKNPMAVATQIDALGMVFSDSGNIHVAAGAAYNVLHLPTAFVMGFNLRFRFLPVQEFHAVYRVIGVEEFGIGEQFDEDAVAILTSSTG